MTLAAFFGYRFLDRAVVWNNHPHDDMLLAEAEKLVLPPPPLPRIRPERAIKLPSPR